MQRSGLGDDGAMSLSSALMGEKLQNSCGDDSSESTTKGSAAVAPIGLCADEKLVW